MDTTIRYGSIQIQYAAAKISTKVSLDEDAFSLAMGKYKNKYAHITVWAVLSLGFLFNWIAHIIK